VQGVRVTACLRADGGLSLSYVLEGDPARLRIPAPARPGRADGLWRHTCCEAFLKSLGGPAYREFNFSPSGLWQAYAFRAYREGGPMETAADPRIVWRGDERRLILQAEIPPALLPPGPRLRLGLAVVLEDADGGLSWWALRHAPGRPDFHHTDTFALQLDLSMDLPCREEAR